MRKIMIAAVAATVLASFPAAAGADPIRDTSCKVQKALGFDNVVGCDLS
jgi:hypothetical protein